MVAGRLVAPFAIPLSPPHSPPMSEAGHDSQGNPLQHATKSTDIAAHDTKPTSATATSVGALKAADTLSIDQHQQARPPLRSYKSFPYSLGPSSRVQDGAPDTSETTIFGDFTERVLSSGPQPTASANLQQPTFGGSAPASPAGQLSPGSAKEEEHDVLMEDEDIDLGDAEEEDATTEKRPMTAAELRAHKRKMKRFRLTHNQTRFLMSEFARQAHPDAAHRERLSREIPGLSPRQVQVWFQNRRAKLKRLTTDDRERMMRSRALPADFDTTQALHSPFSTPNPNMTAPTVSSATFPVFDNGTATRHLSLDTARRAPVYQTYYSTYPSASVVTPALGTGFAFTPPQSATETMSPGSAVGHFSAVNYQTQDSPRRPVVGMPYANQASYASHTPQIPPRLQTHERITRTGGDAAGSPLRSSMSYGAGAEIVSDIRPERSNSLSDQASYTHERPRPSRSNTTSSVASSGPYGLGFSYSNISMYSQVDPNRSSQVAQSSIDYQQPRRNSSHLARPPVTYPQYSSANLSTAQMSQYANYSPGYISSSFQNPYQYQAQGPQQHQSGDQTQMPQQAQQSYTPIQTQPQHLLSFESAAGQQDEPGDGGDGSVPVHLNY